MASTLLSQIADRTVTFLRNTGLSQARLCRYLDVSDSSLCQFLRGTKALDPSTVIKLVQTLNLSQAEVATKFAKPVRTSKILNLQESTQGAPARMRLDAGAWVPGLSGTDPDGSTDITDTPSNGAATGPVWDQALIDTLRATRGFHRKAIEAIDGFITRAKANAGISIPSGVSQKFSS